jgi:hypothetical protein
METKVRVVESVLKAFRGVCLICFCILGIAVVLAMLEFVAFPTLLKATGCSVTDILPSLACGEGWVRRLMEIVLNLPFLFFYAVAFTFTKTGAPAREFMLLPYVFDTILVLALIYPPLFFLTRSPRKVSN